MQLRDFDTLFEALTAREPYPWQRRLFSRLMGETDAPQPPPQALDLPTGLGKTSVMAIWLAARMNGAPLPRRLIYVVDRRAVVDQASAEAEVLADKLSALLEGGALSETDRAKVRGRLGPGGALAISTLRGQFLDNRRWFEDPSAAAIVVGTVDMVGSRLLFGGYGVSRGMRPWHAALIGVDSLVVLDEAHLVPPFEALLKSAAALIGEDVRESPAPAALLPLKLMSLSATGTTTADMDVFRLEPQDWDDPRTAGRLTAPKRVRLEPEVAAGKLAETLADLAWSLGVGEGGRGRRVVVFCNSRRTAQAVADELDKRVAKARDVYGKDARLTALLVGERRFVERQALAASPLFQRFLAKGERGDDAPPGFLVATSAGEVGVDLDADDLVCDLVAWERMVQRLGRVNRRVTPGVAQVRIVPVADDKEAEDAIDGGRLKTLLAPFDPELWPPREDDPHRGDGAMDGSPAGLRELKAARGPVLQAATTPEPLRPPLTRAEAEAWSLTRLETHPGRPKVEPWLRGWVEREAQTQVVWRRWLPLRRGEARVTPDLRTFLETEAPPHLSERLEAPTWRVAEMLRDRAKALVKSRKGEAADAEPDGPAADEPDAEAAGPRPQHPIVVVRLSSQGEVDWVYDLDALANAKPDVLVRELSSGAVVVDARLGGLDGSGLLAKTPGPVRTADGGGWPPELERARGWRVTPFAPTRETSAKADAPTPAPTADPDWKVSEFEWRFEERDTSGGLHVELWRGPGWLSGDPAILRRAQALGDHLSATAKQAARIAQALGLDESLTQVLVAAARAHDLGKNREIWQDAMRAGRDRPYAKTTGGGNGRALEGYRHEFGSLREVEDDLDRHLTREGVVEPKAVELALHLIGAHHGWCRPIIKAYDPGELITLSPARAQAATQRFARLQALWGPWGLAWLEALLRAADWAASADNDASPEPSVAEEEAAHG